VHELLRPTAARLALATMALVGLSSTACNVSGTPRDEAPSAALEDLGGSALTPGGTGKAPDAGHRSLAEAARQSADDLAALIAQGRPLPSRSAEQGSASTNEPWQPPSARVPRGDDARPVPVEASADDSPVGAAEEPAALASVPSPVAEAEAELEPEPDPVAAMLERLERDALNAEQALAASVLAKALRLYADRDDGSRPGQNLSPAERELFEVIDPIISALSSGDRADAPDRIGSVVETAMLELGGVLPVRIRDAALATDIYGFAAYRPFERNTFLAGRENRVLLYTEPSRYVSTPTADPTSSATASNPGAVEVRLGLELRLFNERGSMLAWRRPEERVAIRSDRPRSEIYLGTVIDLPSSLSIGRYQLKVILRDLADSSEDERVIPIQIVADPRLTSRTTRDR